MNPFVWLQSLVTFRKPGGGLQVPELGADGRIRVSVSNEDKPWQTIRMVTGDTTTSPADFTILVDASSGPVTVTLYGPDGSFFNIKKTDGTTNKVKLLPSTGYVDGEPFTELFIRGQSASVQSYSGDWHII